MTKHFQHAAMGEYRAEGAGLRLLPQDLHDQDPNAGALRVIHLRQNRFSAIPERLLEHASLLVLDLSDNDIHAVQHNIVRLALLQELRLAGNCISSLPVELFRLSALTSLNLSRNKITHLLPYVGLMTVLCSVDLSHNDLGSLPVEFALLKSLTSLNLSHNRLSYIPLTDTPALTQLDVRRNVLTALPSCLYAANALASLDASHNQLFVFPEPLPTSVRLIDLSFNAIASVPDSVAILSNLERLYMDENRLTEAPAALEQLSNLAEFSFRGNRIAAISSEIEGHPFATRAFEDNPRIADADLPPPTLGPLSLIKPRSHDQLIAELTALSHCHARYDFELRLRQREQQVNKLEEERKKIDDLAKKVDSINLGGGALSGSMRVARTNEQPLNELKKEIEELQRIVFSDTASVKEIDDANIKLEKAMAAFEKHPESKEAVRKAKEEKRARNDPLNKEALEHMRLVLNPTTVRANAELLKRVGENAELKLLLMEPETILRLHPTDFKTYTLKNTTLEEMRAIRAALPKFRKDQHVQLEWTDKLDDKIESTEMAALAPPTPKRTPRKIVLKKPAPGAASASGSDIFAELLARKQAGSLTQIRPFEMPVPLSPRGAPLSPRGGAANSPRGGNHNNSFSTPSTPQTAPSNIIPATVVPLRVPALPLKPTAAQPQAQTYNAPLPAPPVSAPLSVVPTTAPPNVPLYNSPPPIALPSNVGTVPRPLSTPNLMSPMRLPQRSASPSTGPKRSALAATSSISDSMKAAFDDDTPPLPMGSRTSLASNSSGSLASASAMAAGLPNAKLLEQYEILDAGLNKVLEYGTKGDADVATDTRSTVGEVKKLVEMCRIHNPEGVKPLEAVAGELVSAVKQLLVARNPVARVSLGGANRTPEQAQENLEDIVMQIRERAATAIMH